LAPLFGASLVITVATEPLSNAGAPPHRSLQEKMAATDQLVRSATNCIVRAVLSDPRYARKTAQLGDLISDEMRSCVAPMRAMIDAYDHYYGEGTGEAFFMGPYLDLLPRTIVESAKKTR
jgi:hypothetical protein